MQTNIAFARIRLLYDLIVLVLVLELVLEIQPFEKPSDLDRPNARAAIEDSTRRSSSMKKIVFQTGGPFHPVEAQANLIQSWLPSDWKIKPAFGTEAFEQLANADLYVAGGLHWTVLSDLSALIGSDPEPPIWESAQMELRSKRVALKDQRDPLSYSDAHGAKCVTALGTL